ncbi:hypothetical protein DK926_25655 [Rhodococcus sp. Eu-32]|nr:hypothetical protein DK926_25655 [Rhodococcus sp. Eu-32]
MGLEGDALCGSTWTQRTAPTTVVAPPASSPAVIPQTVHPGSFCSVPGDTGFTTAGTLMVCGEGSDGRDRWKSAN